MFIDEVYYVDSCRQTSIVYFVKTEMMWYIRFNISVPVSCALGIKNSQEMESRNTRQN